MQADPRHQPSCATTRPSSPSRKTRDLPPARPPSLIQVCFRRTMLISCSFQLPWMKRCRWPVARLNTPSSLPVGKPSFFFGLQHERCPVPGASGTAAFHLDVHQQVAGRLQRVQNQFCSSIVSIRLAAATGIGVFGDHDLADKPSPVGFSSASLITWPRNAVKVTIAVNIRFLVPRLVLNSSVGIKRGGSRYRGRMRERSS